MDTKLSVYEELLQRLRNEQHIWLITGVAGFIGSNLLEALLKLDQKVVGLDNFSTGYQKNLDEVQSLVSNRQWSNFNFIEGDIRSLEDCNLAYKDVDFVLHEAAIGSVPRSIEDPIFANQNNIDGFLNILIASRDSQVKRFVYAASSATYGDHPGLPKVEDKIGNPLSPYALTKYVNELYADVFARCYGLETIGLRYFNVFGSRQDPDGPYSAVIPKWIAGMIRNESIYIYGDGETSRDFCYVDNVVQINLLAATSKDVKVLNQIYNVACNESNTLNNLYGYLKIHLQERYPYLLHSKPTYREYREGDVRYSLADISKASTLLSFKPFYGVNQGLEKTVAWFVDSLLKIDTK